MIARGRLVAFDTPENLEKQLRSAQQIRLTAGPILNHEENAEITTEHAEDLIMLSAIMGGFTRVFAEKLLLLDGKTLSNGGSVAQSGVKRDKKKDKE